MFRKLSVAFLIATMFVAAVLARLPVGSTLGAGQEELSLFGDWRGESICQARNSPCHDEKVVYHFSKGRTADRVNVSADKIADGSAVNMGTLEFKYDKEARTLVNSEHGRWELSINGKKIEGTLTLPNGTLYRRITLVKKEE